MAEPTDPEPGTYTVAEVCRLLRVDDATLRKGVEAGTLPAPLRLGRRVLFPRRAVDALLAGAAGGAAVLTASLR